MLFGRSAQFLNAPFSFLARLAFAPLMILARLLNSPLAISIFSLLLKFKHPFGQNHVSVLPGREIVRFDRSTCDVHIVRVSWRPGRWKNCTIRRWRENNFK